MTGRADDFLARTQGSAPAGSTSTTPGPARGGPQGGRQAVRVGLALAAGAAWAAAAPPRGWWPLLSLGVAALALALRGRQARERWLLGGLAGVVFYGSTLRWLIGFSVLGYLAMTLLEAALLAAAVWLVPAGRSGRWSGPAGSGSWWTLPAALVLLAAVQVSFPLGGFPLPGLALSQPSGPFALAAPLGGSLLVTATAAAGGVALAALVGVRGRRRRLVAAAGALAVAVLPVIVGGAVATRGAGTLDVAIVQGGGPRGVPAVFDPPAQVTERQLVVLRQITDPPDLVVLPEDVVGVDGSVAGSLPDRQIAAQARRLKASVVVGVVETQPNGFRNAAVLWGPDGNRLDRYEKEHRVPFGEYIPARALLERLTDATALVPRDAIPGRGQALLRAPVAPLGVVISYEVFFADRVREAVADGGQIVLVPTNAASFVTPEVPALEMAAARLRARETGRTVLQAAPTGYSVVVLPTGKVLAQSRLGAPALLRQRVPLRTGLTPYTRVGDLPMIVLAIATLLAPPVTARVRSPRRRARAG